MDIVFAESYYDSLTGAQQSMLPLLTQSEKITPHVLCPGEGEFTSEVRRRNIDCTIIEFPDVLDRDGKELTKKSIKNYVITGKALFSYQIKGCKFFNKFDVDLLYCNNIKSLLLYGFAAKANGVPVVMYARVDDNYPGLDDVAFLLCSSVILISDGVKKRFSSTRFNTELETIYTGVNVEEYSRNKVEEELEEELNRLYNSEVFTITQVASITGRKAQMDLVKALNRIPDNNNIKVRFVGEVYDRKYKGQIDEYLNKNNLTENVEFHGWKDDVRPYYYTSDVFVLPSYNEGFPRTILEALSMGTAVIATPAGGTDEIIEHEKTGLLTPMDDPDTLVERISHLIRNPALCQELGKNGQRVVEEQFKTEIYVSNFEDYVLEKFNR